MTRAKKERERQRERERDEKGKKSNCAGNFLSRFQSRDKKVQKMIAKDWNFLTGVGNDDVVST